MFAPFLLATVLNGLLPGPIGFQPEESLEQIRKSRDVRYAAPLADILRFADDRPTYHGVAQAFERLTKTKILNRPNPWEAAVEWLADRDLAPEGYTTWKGELFARKVDPRYREMFYAGAPSRIRVHEIQWGGVRIGGIPALLNPKMLSAAAATYLTGAEPVFGVSIAGDHRAYPLRILDWHEMANDVVGGRPVALAYCTLCGAGILFDSAAGGAPARQFGSSGLLYRSNKLMFDSETGTLWNQFTGEPVLGRLATSGIRLPVLPLVLTSWAEWKRQHPDTKVLDPRTGYARDYEVGATYGRYFGSPATMFPVWKRSDVLPRKARVYGVRIGLDAKAYPLDDLERAGGVVNDDVAGKPLVVIARETPARVALPERWKQALAREGAGYANDLSIEQARRILKKSPDWIRDLTVEMLLAMPVAARLALLEERTVDERMGDQAPVGKFTPNFRNEVAQRGLIGETRAYERGSHRFSRGKAADEVVDEKGRAWRVTEESLVGGDGERLARLPGHLAYWLGWYAFLPETAVYRAP